jgi:hypothetical protein
MSRENLNITANHEVIEGDFTEIEQSPLEKAVEAAEAVMVPLMVDDEAAERICQDLLIPGIPAPETKGMTFVKTMIDTLEAKRKAYTGLKIRGIADKVGAEAVYKARIEMKNIRLHIEKRGAELTAESKKHINNVKIVKEFLIEKSDVTENYLQDQEAAYKALIDAEKAAKQKILDERNQSRMVKLLAVEDKLGLAAVVNMDDQAFENYLKIVTKVYNERKELEAKQAEEAEAKAKAEAEAKAKADKEIADRLEAERIANAAAKAENDRLAAELKAQREEFESLQAQAAAVAQAEQARKDAEEKAKAIAEKTRLEDEARAEQKAKDEAARIESEKAKALAIEAAKPDAEKIRAYAHSFTNLDIPDMTTEAGKIARENILNASLAFTKFIIKQAENITKESGVN